MADRGRAWRERICVLVAMVLPIALTPAVLGVLAWDRVADSKLLGLACSGVAALAMAGAGLALEAIRQRPVPAR